MTSELYNLNESAKVLQKGGVIAYPTETVWGLGALASKPSAIRKILALKKRPANKGLILLANQLSQLEPYIALDRLNQSQLEKLQSHQKKPTTWIVPAKATTSVLLKGDFDSLAVRISSHALCTQLISLVDDAIVSTSANVSGQPTCQNENDIQCTFKKGLSGILSGELGGHKWPSQIINILTGEVLRA